MAAAAYFRQLGPYYAKDQWSELELIMSDMYAQCLEYLGRNEEFVEISLKIITRLAETLKTNSSSQHNHSTPFGVVARKGYLSKVVSASNALRECVLASLDNYSGSIFLGHYIKHESRNDSFFLRIDIDHILMEGFHADEVRCKLTWEDTDADDEIVLSAQNVDFEPQSRVIVYLASNKMIPGNFVVDQIQVCAGQLVFIHNLSGTRDDTSIQQRSITDFSSKKGHHHRVVLWPQPKALDVQLSMFNTRNLAQRRSLLLKVFSGWNSITRGSLTVRAASAGLRLHTSDAQNHWPSIPIISTTEPGLIKFDRMLMETVLQVQLPYTLENDLSEIMIKVEVAYTTSKGDFVYASTLKTKVTLALVINVQDNFQKESLISKFTMGTATTIPVRIMACEVHGTEEFSVTSLPMPPRTDVFPRRPASLFCKIIPKKGKKDAEEHHRSQRELRLSIQYACLDEEIEATVEDRFKSMIEVSPFSKMARLLVQPIISYILDGIRREGFEIIGLLREFNVPLLHEGALDYIVDGLPPKYRGPLLLWLQKWQKVSFSRTIAPTILNPGSDILQYICRRMRTCCLRSKRRFCDR